MGVGPLCVPLIPTIRDNRSCSPETQAYFELSCHSLYRNTLSPSSNVSCRQAPYRQAEQGAFERYCDVSRGVSPSDPRTPLRAAPGGAVRRLVSTVSAPSESRARAAWLP